MPNQDQELSPGNFLQFLQRGGCPDIEEEIVAHPDVYLDPDVAYRSMAISRWNAMKSQDTLSDTERVQTVNLDPPHREATLKGADRAKAVGRQTRRERLDLGESSRVQPAEYEL